MGDRLAGARRRLRKLSARLAQFRVREGDTGPSSSAGSARVSVIVPVFNAMPYLRELLDSLADQDLDPALFEVIAVDDGSTDGGGRLLDDVASRHPNWRVIHEKNSGWPGHPRNVGIDAATGDYLFFCDADDRMGPESLRRMVAFADEHDVDVVAPRLVALGGRRIQSSLFTATVVDVDARTVLATLSPQKLIRRSLIEAHGIRFPEGKIRLEDGMMLTRCYLRSRRIAILADYDHYFLRQRDDGRNISSERVHPESYTESVTELARIILELEPDPRTAELMVLDLFRRKALRFYAPERLPAMSALTRRRWVHAHVRFMERFVPERLDSHLEFPYRQRAQLIRSRDISGLESLASTQRLLEQNPRASRVTLDAEAVSFDVDLDPADEVDIARIVARVRDGDAEAAGGIERRGTSRHAVFARADLAELGPVLVDVVVELRAGDIVGTPRRVRAPAEGLPLASGSCRIYSTVKGNLSVDLR
ncbi:glycosyltransferase family 2 protein [Brevibacterium celere]|uniref:glycosyltransferase family 2 protein n=1 Tax=Brevibacterium celere TaxID=225845 RepID=UPI0011BDA3A4|nr:glycosyltransferase family 2 protein [Brevibacterium celere]